ncbi:NADH-dependent phenylglyoxylate dehydrogenase subunit alpha [Thauera aromatica]|uniref:NADH-dependent phenylglyoxylate dehydrogenase alpha subunit PadG n=1 Tax=Thauera aromatica K172 TaxID=44139 RepID=A0A2R4BLM6_THAAR|nr:phenylglyoxylate dehydrogenase [Thauera aromatica]AVR88220.1 NADH-dependent phenylglyoxylate dehydrogenase alpha subunit PadG [Thauera aromatica K172]MCK2095004.1 phenylglyoxylate dehydrogenase [Thauera aromatica]
MSTTTIDTPNTDAARATTKAILCEGNEAAALGVALARPDMVAVYPITPQTSLVEKLASLIAEGRMDADIVDAEGEHSVLSVLQGGALAGARTYTATCGPGLAFMFEPYLRTSGMRLPLVMTIVTRDGITPQSVWGGHQDAMTVRESGWIQMYCETVQEVLDTTVMAFKLAEHHDIMLPVNVCLDGNYLSYGASRIELPEQAEVDAFMGAKDVNWHVALDPQRPMAVDPLTGGSGGNGPETFARYRRGQCRGMQNALRVITEIHEEWGERFGHHFAPLVEEYRLDDAEYAIMTLGSMTGAAKDAIDEARAAGEKVGLIKIKTFSPFPVAALKHALRKVRALGVVDRSVAFRWNCGPMFQETLGVLYRLGRHVPAQSFIGGLAGADLTTAIFHRVIDETRALLTRPASDEPVWLNAKD